MTSETITGEHRLARLVGREAYVDAGGRIERDLFADAADELWLDSDIVQSLAKTRMAEAAAQIIGYAKVVPTLDHRPDWALTQTLRAVHGERIAPSDADETRLAEIDDQLEAIEANAEDPDGYEFSDAEAEQVEALQAEADALRNRVAPVDDATRTVATAFMVIDAEGQPKLYETVYIDPHPVTFDETGEGAGPIVEPDDDTLSAPALGKVLRDELAVQRTQLLALHVASDSNIAIDLAIFLLADTQVRHGHGFDNGSTLRAPRPTRAPFGYKPEGAANEQMRLIEDSLDHDWATSRDIGERFDAFRALDAEKRGAWAGWTLANTLEAQLGDEPSAKFHNHLGRSLGIDVAAWWRPTAANFFNRVRKSVVLDTLDAIGGSDLKSRYAAAKKGDLANAAEKLCAGTSIVEAEVRAAALAWVPDVMLFAGTAEASGANEDGVASDQDDGSDGDGAVSDNPDASSEHEPDDDEAEQAA
jgi:ParB family transcriptional regulator, chromosome partitioning protein